MYRIEQAEIKDVDFILDIKLDIIFSSEEVIKLEKSEMEKIVNYTEEEIRDNIDNYKLVYSDESLVAIYAIFDYDDGKLIDTMYVMPNYRNCGIAKNILNEIINKNFQCLYLWVYKNNDIAVDFYKKSNFIIIEETEYRYFMKNINLKDENNNIKIKLFEEEVDKLAKKYGIEYIIKTKLTTKKEIKQLN